MGPSCHHSPPGVITRGSIPPHAHGSNCAHPPPFYLTSGLQRNRYRNELYIFEEIRRHYRVIQRYP